MRVYLIFLAFLMGGQAVFCTYCDSQVPTCPTGTVNKGHVYCGSSCNVASCCVYTCNSYTCNAGSISKSNPSTIACGAATSDCNQLKCCDTLAKCSSFTNCESGKTLRSDATTTYCPTAALTSCTSALCCVPYAKCDTFNCPTGSISKANPNTISCSGSATTSCNSATCCDQLAKCGAYPCPEGYTAKAGSTNTYCSGPLASSCTTDLCCSPVYNCGSYSCPAGYNPKAPSVLCGTTAGSCTKTKCCDLVPKFCSPDYTCPTGYYAKPGGSTIACGALCSATKCCNSLAAQGACCNRFTGECKNVASSVDCPDYGFIFSARKCCKLDSGSLPCPDSVTDRSVSCCTKYVDGAQKQSALGECGTYASLVANYEVAKSQGVSADQLAVYQSQIQAATAAQSDCNTFCHTYSTPGVAGDYCQTPDMLAFCQCDNTGTSTSSASFSITGDILPALCPAGQTCSVHQFAKVGSTAYAACLTCASQQTGTDISVFVNNQCFGVTAPVVDP